MYNKTTIEYLLMKEYLNKQDIISLLSSNEEDSIKLFAKAAEIKKQYVGNKVYLRGLIEYSNYCTKLLLLRDTGGEQQVHTLSDDR